MFNFLSLGSSSALSETLVHLVFKGFCLANQKLFLTHVAAFFISLLEVEMQWCDSWKD